MRLEDIRSLTRAVPFRPFRVFLSTGETFDIRHPDMIMASLGAAHIATPPPGGTADQADRATIVSLIHIQKIEYLPGPAPAQPGTNGPATGPAGPPSS